MIRITNEPAIKFEKVIKEIVVNILTEYEFIFEDDIPSPNQDSNTFLSRKRKGIKERIGFIRKSYSDKYDKDCDDEVEREPYIADENDTYRNSRHLFKILLTVNHSHRELLTTGKAEIGRNGEEYWYFEDEEDLRKLLKEKIVPLLTTVAMKDFDEQLEDELEYLAQKGSKQSN